jgi:hypothetical protein
MVNIASPGYHTLHIDQLGVLHGLWPLEPIGAAAVRFADYAATPSCRVRAVSRKVAFRTVVRKGDRASR